MTRGSCRTTKNSAVPDNLRMIGIVGTIRFSIFVLLIASVIVGSGAHDSSAYSRASASASASASAGAGAGAGASASALSNANAFTGIGSIPGTDGSHDGHKGIRSYDNTGYGGNNQPNSGIKGNRGSGCSKCKWEDDDYWEKDEEESEPEEKEEDDCYDGDDGQYREHDHNHNHDHGHGRKGGSHPGVHKIGAPNPIDQGPYTGTGNTVNTGNNAASGATPVKGGYPQTGGPLSGSPWNKPYPVPNGGTFSPVQPSNQQSGPGWDTGSGTTPKSSWNQGYSGSPRGTGSHPSGSWSAGPESSANTGASSPLGGTWNNGPETGSGCFGSYQLGTGCAQDSNGAGPVKQAPVPFVGANTGNVQKQASPNYSTSCSGSPYGNCADSKPVGQTGSESNPVGPSNGPTAGQGQRQYPGTGSQQSNSFGPSYGPIAVQAQHPGSGSSESKTRYGPGTGPLGPTPGSSVNTGSSERSTIPQNTNSAANAVSSSMGYAGAGSSVTGSGLNTGHPNSSPFGNSATPGSPNGNGPYGAQKPSYTGVKGGSLKPDTGSGSYPTQAAPDKTTSGASTSTGTTASGGSTLGHDASNNGDSKIFYINVNPVPGSPGGVKPHTTPSTPYTDTRTTKSSYQPSPYGGTGTIKPSYQPGPYGGAGTTKPSYQPGPYDGIGTTKPSYQPGPYGGTAVTAQYPDKFSPGTDATKSPSGGTSTGCTSGSQSCGDRIGCSRETNPSGSPGYKPCDQPEVPGDINKTSGPSGDIGTYSPDFSQNSQPVVPGRNGQPFGGTPAGTASGPYGCTPGTNGCAFGPGSSSSSTYVDKTGNVNKIPGGGAGSYPWNPFLNGKLPNPSAGGPIATTIGKPVGHGNPFLQGTVQPGNIGAIAGAGAWSHAGSVAGTGPNYNDNNVPSSIGKDTAKPIGKDNPFLGGSGATRGDIGIDDIADPTPGGSPIPGASNNGPVQTNGSPSGSSTYYPGSSWNSKPVIDESFSGVKNPSATNRGSGSGGGVGIGTGGFGSLPEEGGHGNGNSFSGAFSGAISSSQASNYANSKAGSYTGPRAPDATLGQANSGSWASSGANAGSQAGSSSWSSSGASAYASSSANSWAGAGSIPVKG